MEKVVNSIIYSNQEAIIPTIAIGSSHNQHQEEKKEQWKWRNTRIEFEEQLRGREF